MTDRAKGCYVAFSKDIRTDDVEGIINAIMMIKGVSNVELNIADPDDFIIRSRISDQLREKIFEMLEELRL